MDAITWAGTVAGALIAVATVVHWTIRRAIRVGTWLAAAVQLPTEVDRLAASVTDLSAAVAVLADTIRPTTSEEPHEIVSC